MGHFSGRMPRKMPLRKVPRPWGRGWGWGGLRYTQRGDKATRRHGNPPVGRGNPIYGQNGGYAPHFARMRKLPAPGGGVGGGVASDIPNAAIKQHGDTATPSGKGESDLRAKWGLCTPFCPYEKTPRPWGRGWGWGKIGVGNYPM